MSDRYFQFNHTDNPDLPHAQVIDTATGAVLYSDTDKAAYDMPGVSYSDMTKTLAQRFKEHNEKQVDGQASTGNTDALPKASSKKAGSGKVNDPKSARKVSRKAS